MFEKLREKFIHSSVGRVYLWLVAVVGSLVSAFVLFWVLSIVVVLVRAAWDIVLRLNELLSQQSWMDWAHKHIGYADIILESGLIILFIVTVITVKDYVKGSKYKQKRRAIQDHKTGSVEQLLPTSNRKLVICIDGTNDFAASTPTHVYQVAEMLKGQDNVVVYYDGGVGTLEDSSVISGFKRKLYQGFDLAFGISVRGNVVNGYTFLVNNYMAGDEIYLFGFSRGAYGARVLGGVLGLFGLLEKTQENLIPFIWQTYKNLDGGWDQDHIEAMKEGMSLRSVKIAYIGVWDTVSTIGYLRQRTFPYTGSLPAVEGGRHAVAIDEHRNMFPENLVAGSSNVEECWFAGVHRDIGGGGNQDANPLAEIPFRWVLEPVQGRFELKFTVPCDPTVQAWNQNDVMAAGYGIAGLFPQRIWTKDSTGGRYRWHWFRCWHVRKPQAGVNIHVSVVERAKAIKGYLPKAFLDSNFAPKRLVKVIGDTSALRDLDAPVKTHSVKQEGTPSTKDQVDHSN